MSPKIPYKGVYSEILSKGVFKLHPSLIPLVACVGAGVAWATCHLYSLAFNNPDVHWTDKAGEMANTKWPINKQARYRVFDAKSSEEYAAMKFPEERPDIDNMWRAYLNTKAPVK